MDISKLAQDVTVTLTPCLPFLVDVGKDLAKEAADPKVHEALESWRGGEC